MSSTPYFPSPSNQSTVCNKSSEDGSVNYKLYRH